MSRLDIISDTIIDIESSIFNNLKSLVLCKSNFPPEKFEVINKNFPNLATLELRGSTINVPAVFSVPSFENLIKLNLAYCKIRNFQDIEALNSYSKLAELKLCNNPIETIEYHGGFLSLRKLNLEGTKLNNLSHVDNLNLFPALTEIRLGNNPLAKRLNNHLRKMMVSYLYKATKINGGIVDSKERTLHERQFIRDFSDPDNSNEHSNSSEYLGKLLGFQLEKTEIDINKRIYLSHLQAHGTVHKFAEVNLAPPTTANLIFETEDGRKETKEVPLGWKVVNLKKLCQGLFGIPENQQKLFYLDSEIPIIGMEILRFDNKVIRSIRMKDNDVIMVRVKD